MEIKPLKAKKCRECKTLFTPVRPLQIACSIDCARIIARKNGNKKSATRLREGREKLKTLSDYKNDLQVLVNRYVRLKDAARYEKDGCISCGSHTGKLNAGHYLSRGARPEHRFNLDNIKLQCEHCNSFKSGNQQAYRVNLIKHIGLNAVESLESDHEQKHYTIDQIKELNLAYRAKIKEIQRLQG